MTRDLLIEKLRLCEEMAKIDLHNAHILFDETLLCYIDDPEISHLYHKAGFSFGEERNFEESK